MIPAKALALELLHVGARLRLRKITNRKINMKLALQCKIGIKYSTCIIWLQFLFK